jgi:hypothetical protein
MCSDSSPGIVKQAVAKGPRGWGPVDGPQKGDRLQHELEVNIINEAEGEATGKEAVSNRLVHVGLVLALHELHHCVLVCMRPSRGSFFSGEVGHPIHWHPLAPCWPVRL